MSLKMSRQFFVAAAAKFGGFVQASCLGVLFLPPYTFA